MFWDEAQLGMVTTWRSPAVARATVSTRMVSSGGIAAGTTRSTAEMNGSENQGWTGALRSVMPSRLLSKANMALTRLVRGAVAGLRTFTPLISRVSLLAP